MKYLKKGLMISLFAYFLMYNGQFAGGPYNTLGQCQAAAPSQYHYCIWN